VHDNVFCEYVNVIIVGIIDIHYTSSAVERSIRQSRDNFPC